MSIDTAYAILRNYFTSYGPVISVDDIGASDFIITTTQGKYGAYRNRRGGWNAYKMS